MSENQTAQYWIDMWPFTVLAYSIRANTSVKKVCKDLALIAGDYHDMDDQDVLDTYLAELD